MKTHKKYTFITLTLLSIAQLFMCHRYIDNKNFFVLNQDSTIIGTWISDEDNKWKLEFRNDSTCISSYTGSPSDTSYYHISNTSPQCGIAVPTENYTNYLQLNNVNDSNDKVCYLINGITGTNLSLSVVDKGGILVFKKEILSE